MNWIFSWTLFYATEFFHCFLFPEHYISKQDMKTLVKNISEVFETKFHKNNTKTET